MRTRTQAPCIDGYSIAHMYRIACSNRILQRARRGNAMGIGMAKRRIRERDRRREVAMGACVPKAYIVSCMDMAFRMCHG